MKVLIILSVLSSLTFAYADGKDAKKRDHDDHKRHQKHESRQVFELVPLNSPVKSATANFLLKVPTGFEIDRVSYRIKNAHRLFDKDKNFDPIKLFDGSQGKELHVPVSKLPPGFYQLFVKVIDKKTREHDCRGKLKDHAMFVIDSSLGVPAPNEKENNKTIGGIDSNNDLIRDDVERWINEEFNSRPKVLMAVKQLARSRQVDLLSVGNKDQSILASRKLLDSLGCLGSIVELNEKAKISSKIKSSYLNTQERLFADIKANANFSGQGYELSDGDQKKLLCDFDPDSI